jgi:hypothetical protein
VSGFQFIYYGNPDNNLESSCMITICFQPESLAWFHLRCSTSGCRASNDRISEQWNGKDLKGSEHASIETLNSHFPRRSSGNHERSVLRCEPSTSTSPCSLSLWLSLLIYEAIEAYEITFISVFVIIPTTYEAIEVYEITLLCIPTNLWGYWGLWDHLAVYSY